MSALVKAALAALVLAAPATAFGDDLTRSRGVASRELDLRQGVDAEVMLTRLERAAGAVCGASRFSAREVRQEVRRSTCYRDALGQAVASLNAPTLNALYRERAPQIAAN